MEKIQVNVGGTSAFVRASGIEALVPDGKAALSKLTDGSGLGNDFLGWVKLPSETSKELLDDICATAKRMRELCDVVVAIGIGGSYLGAKAVIEGLSNSFAPYIPTDGTRVLFAGQNIGEDYLYELKEYLKDKKFGIIVISKSGTTTEPAIAYRILREKL